MEKVCSVTTDPTQCAFSLKNLVKNLLFVIVIIEKASISTTTTNPTEQPITKARFESKLPSRFLKKIPVLSILAFKGDEKCIILVL